MGGWYEEAPFGRGQTFRGVGGPAAGSTDGAEYEGREFWFPDQDFSTGKGLVRSGQYVLCRIVRNIAAFNILPSRVVNLTAGRPRQVDGYQVTGGGECFVSDEWLPAAGVAQYDLFYIVVKGPTLAYTGLAGNATNVIAAKDPVTALTSSATSGATTSGRIKSADYTGATAVLGNEVLNTIGRAMSAATTAETNTLKLVNVGAHR